MEPLSEQIKIISKEESQLLSPTNFQKIAESAQAYIWFVKPTIT